MTRWLIGLAAAMAVAGACAQDRAPPRAADEMPSGNPLDGLRTQTRPWPGRIGPDLRQRMGDLPERLAAAMNAGDAAAIARHRDALIAIMGAYAGTPEERPLYGLPIDATEPDIARIVDLWTRQADWRTGRRPWEDAARIARDGGVPQRLRTSTRIARAGLHVLESGAPGADRYRADAIALADYLLGVQAANGVFGYPYDPAATSGVRGEAARFVARARAEGKEIAANGWMIDDLQNGGLNFDNAQAGLFLIHVHALTGDPRYRAAAVRAGEWAMGRRLVNNYNYNGFNGQLLARLYRLTGERRYLDRARTIFEFGVLSGQLPNGRWFDQHNAKIQYHAIIMIQLAEFWLALEQARDPFAATVRDAMVRGLDNLAAEITTYGSSNTHELLAVEALATGSTILGQREAWTRAIRIDVNFLVNELRPKLERLGVAMPDALGTYILFARGHAPGASAIDTRVGPIVPRAAAGG